MVCVLSALVLQCKCLRCSLQFTMVTVPSGEFVSRVEAGPNNLIIETFTFLSGPREPIVGQTILFQPYNIGKRSEFKHIPKESAMQWSQKVSHFTSNLYRIHNLYISSELNCLWCTFQIYILCYK